MALCVCQLEKGYAVVAVPCIYVRVNRKPAIFLKIGIIYKDDMFSTFFRLSLLYTFYRRFPYIPTKIVLPPPPLPLPKVKTWW